MAIKKVIRMGHPTLRLKARELTREEILSKQTQELINDMRETMAHESGIGIAAPQIDVSLQAAIIHLPGENPRYGELEEGGEYVNINQSWEVLDDEQKGFWEGCLSVPGLRGLVERPRKIKLRYLDIEAREQELVVEDFLATVFQHELDHLFGVLYVVHVQDPKLLMYQEEFDEFYEGEGDDVLDD